MSLSYSNSWVNSVFPFPQVVIKIDAEQTGKKNYILVLCLDLLIFPLWALYLRTFSTTVVFPSSSQFVTINFYPEEYGLLNCKHHVVWKKPIIPLKHWGLSKLLGITTQNTSYSLLWEPKIKHSNPIHLVKSFHSLQRLNGFLSFVLPFSVQLVLL